MSSAERIREIWTGPALSTKIAANGRAVRVISEPKIETVLADQIAAKLRSRQSGACGSGSSPIAASPSSASESPSVPLRAATGSSSAVGFWALIAAEA